MTTQIATIIFTLLMVGLSIFQILLVLGLPYGEFAWGGQHTVLPKGLRIGSAISVAIYAVMISIVLNAAEIVDIYPKGFIDSYGMWFLLGYFGLGIFVNAISRSKKERYTMTPIITILFLCTQIILLTNSN